MNTLKELRTAADAIFDSIDTTAVHSAPVKGARNGDYGRITDVRVRLYMGNYRAKNPLAPTIKGKCDTRKYGHNIAIKTGYGEITPCDANLQPTSKEFIGCDFVVWCGDAENTPIGEMLVARVNDLMGSNIIRYVTSSKQYRLKREGKISEVTKDQIQFITTKSRVNEWFRVNAIGTLDEWLSNPID